MGLWQYGLTAIVASALFACGGDDGAKAGSGGKSGTGGSTTGGTGGAGGAGGATGTGGSTAGTGGNVGKACALPNRDFWTWDLSLMPPPDLQVNAKCVSESDHAYVFVAQQSWDSGAMSQTQVDKILNAFEKATPADSTRGIYATDTETFGSPPDVDGDPHIFLFYYPLGDFQGTSFDGYFRDSDQSPASDSNQVEMLHLNATGQHAPDSDYMLGVVIHEFVHLINWQYDKGEEGWLNESLAESAMTLGGYQTDLQAAQAYVTKTATTSLCFSQYVDYGAVFSWGSYMLDRWGTSFLKDVLQDPAHGAASLEAHFSSGGKFRTAFGDFMVANLLDQPQIGDGRYGYKSIDLSAVGSETTGVLDGVEHAATASAWGARMLRFEPAAAGNLQVTLNSAEISKLVVYSVVFAPNQPSGAEVAPQPTASAPSNFSVTVGAGKVVDLIVAIDAGQALSGSTAPSTSFTYTAKLN